VQEDVETLYSLLNNNLSTSHGSTKPSEIHIAVHFPPHNFEESDNNLIPQHKKWVSVIQLGLFRETR
jgi:hypothetical protein